MTPLPDGKTSDGMMLRPARPVDQQTIRALVRSEGLDPTGLTWEHFTVAEADGEIIGAGQIRPYPRCRELGSLVVRPAWRRRGVGERLVRAILATEIGDVYLECPQQMAPYYARFGFEPTPLGQTPMPLKLKAAAGKVLMRLMRDRLVVMVRRSTSHREKA